MSTLTTIRRVARYLTLVNAFPRWLIAAFGIFAVYGAVVSGMGGHGSDALYLYLILVPVAAGTGLLHTAREGKLDLLFGSLVSRATVWRVAWTRAVLLPALTGAILAALLSAALDPGFVLCVLASTLATASIGFGLGVFRARDAAGVTWIVLRVAFLVSPFGRTIYGHVKAVSSGVSEPQFVKLMLAGLVIPEVLLTKKLPLMSFAGLILAASAALALSYFMFTRADLGGHRGN